jgi:hypothetical protein
MNILNICILIYLVSYLFTSIIELFKIDYMTLLANINYDGKGGDSVKSIVDHKLNSSIFYYLLCIYLISIYIYSAYLIRYSKTFSEYDIISNFDADETITNNYVSNLILSEYASNMHSNFDSSYTNKEFAKASKVVMSYHYDVPESNKKPEKNSYFKEFVNKGFNVVNSVSKLFKKKTPDENPDKIEDDNKPQENNDDNDDSDNQSTPQPAPPQPAPQPTPSPPPLLPPSPPPLLPPPSVFPQQIPQQYQQIRYGHPQQYNGPQGYQPVSPLPGHPQQYYRPQGSYGQQPPNFPQPSYGQQPPNFPQPSYGQQPPNFPQPSYGQQPLYGRF